MVTASGPSAAQHIELLAGRPVDSATADFEAVRLGLLGRPGEGVVGGDAGFFFGFGDFFGERVGEVFDRFLFAFRRRPRGDSFGLAADVRQDHFAEEFGLQVFARFFFADFDAFFFGEGFDFFDQFGFVFAADRVCFLDEDGFGRGFAAGIGRAVVAGAGGRAGAGAAAAATAAGGDRGQGEHGKERQGEFALIQRKSPRIRGRDGGRNLTIRLAARAREDSDAAGLQAVSLGLFGGPLERGAGGAFGLLGFGNLLGERVGEVFDRRLIALRRRQCGDFFALPGDVRQHHQVEDLCLLSFARPGFGDRDARFFDVFADFFADLRVALAADLVRFFDEGRLGRALRRGRGAFGAGRSAGAGVVAAPSPTTGDEHREHDRGGECEAEFGLGHGSPQLGTRLTRQASAVGRPQSLAVKRTDRNPPDERETGIRKSGDRGERGHRNWPCRGLDHYRRHDPAGAVGGLGLARGGESRRRLRQDRGRPALPPAGHHRPQGSGPLRRHRRGDRRGARRQGRAAQDPR